jgi:phosphoribosylaminoimidazole-succinocarboxamide synthase
MSPAPRLRARGKVRDVYDAGEERLLLVATDRISAFDVVLPDPVPDKGRVLTGLSSFWFDRVTDLVPHHVVSTDRAAFPPPFGDEPALAGRATLVKKATVVPMECVARGYLAGSGWAQYRETSSVCGVPLPPGLTESARLAEPIFTPTTKADTGHDLPLDGREAADLVGKGLFERLKELTLEIYGRLAETAAATGILVADTKLEFGFAEGELILIDEVGTPDSSRFWPADAYAAGGVQPSFDKQFVRDWLDGSGWDREPPPPALPRDVIEGTAARYREAYERITGEAFDGYLSRAGVSPRDDDKARHDDMAQHDDKAPDDDTALERLREGRA